MRLSSGQTIAIVGLSAKPDRPSFGVAQAMQHAGFRIIPVNPQYVGREILGQPVHGSLGGIADTVDIVNCFRKSEEMPGVAEDLLMMQKLPRMLWMQQGIRSAAAKALAEAAGVEVVEDRCIKIAFFSQD